MLTLDNNLETLHFQPTPSGAVEITKATNTRNSGAGKRRENEQLIAIIPKEDRARVAHFLVTGEVK